MMMEEFEYRSLLKQLKKKNLIFDDVMHKEKSTLIHWYVFLTRGAGTSIKTFTLKLIIKELLRLYNRDIFYNLNKNQGFTYGINR